MYTAQTCVFQLQVNFITMQCFKKVQLYAGFDKYNLSISK